MTTRIAITNTDGTVLASYELEYEDLPAIEAAIFRGLQMNLGLEQCEHCDRSVRSIDMHQMPNGDTQAMCSQCIQTLERK